MQRNRDHGEARGARRTGPAWGDAQPDAGTRSRRSFLAAGTAAAATAALARPALAQSALAAESATKFRRVPTQYIAALADTDAQSGDNAETWGLWPVDPGPRGVRLERFEQLAASGVAPAGWTFDKSDWWLEEHGLIMEAPQFPLPAGKYLVTGNRQATSVLTVEAADGSGRQRWALDADATVYDVTHLRCRSGRYTSANGTCTPAQASQADFPVEPGAEMPAVAGCSKQDYAVLIVFGVGVENA